MIQKLIFSLLLTFVAIFAYSQQTADSTFNSISEVVIEGSRLSGTSVEMNADVQIISRKQIESLPVQSIHELLGTVAGVDIRRRGPGGTQADIVIDGSTFDQVLVLINGVKMSDPQTGHHLMNLPIPLEMVDHIEIIRGSLGRSYGVNALAGAVNIITKIPLQDMVFAEVKSGSSFETDSATNETYYNYGVQAGAAFHKDSQAHMLSLSYDKGNGYRYNSGFENFKLFYQNQFYLKNHVLETMGAFIYNDFGANAFYAAPGDKESNETVQIAFGSIRDDWQVNEKLMIRPRFAFRYGNDDYKYIRQKPSEFRNQHETNVVNADVNGTYTFGKHVLGIGVEWRNENIRSSNLGFHTRDNAGIFAEYQFKSGKFSGGAGVYGNYNSDWGFELFPGADFGYSATKEVKIFANVGSGQRLPTYTDLYYDGPSNIGNASLNPETGVSAEMGIKYNKPVIQMDASVSYKNISDFIDYTRANEMEDWQPNNFQTIQTTVYNFRFVYQAGKHLNFRKSNNLQFTTSYTYTEPAVEANTGYESKYAIESLRHQWVNTINFSINKLSALVLAKYQFRINGNDYTIIDSRISYGLGRITVFADVSNILDAQYAEISSVPLPGRWFGAGLKLVLKK